MLQFKIIQRAKYLQYIPVGYMQVTYGCPDVIVTKQFRDDSDIHRFIRQMCGKVVVEVQSRFPP